MATIDKLEIDLFRLPLPVAMEASAAGVMTAFDMVTARITDSDGAAGTGVAVGPGSGVGVGRGVGVAVGSEPQAASVKSSRSRAAPALMRFRTDVVCVAVPPIGVRLGVGGAGCQCGGFTLTPALSQVEREPSPRSHTAPPRALTVALDSRLRGNDGRGGE